MASPLISSLSLRHFIFPYFLCLSSLFHSNEGYPLEGRKFAKSHTHIVEVSSLFQAGRCTPTDPKAGKDILWPAVPVIQVYGPCSTLTKEEAKAPTLEEIIRRDESRVKSLQARVSSKVSGDFVKVTDATTIPARPGRTIGSANYVVTVGLGTPKKDLTLAFDTGSDLTWTQCKPCVGSCYQQKEPIFDPSQSSTYTNVSCSSSVCSSINPAPGTQHCASSTCLYGIGYGDGSFSVGFLASDKLTISSTDYLDKFYFGCGQDNEGLFNGAAGLLGLSRDSISLVSQATKQHNKIFSYCLPSAASSNGYLKFGGSSTNSAKFTPLSTSSPASLYGIDFTAISVGGTKLSIPASVFTTAGAIIDSGTVITRLPPTAYSALRSAFRQAMSKYPAAPARSIFDTCYDLSKSKTVEVPKISFFFKGEVEVDLGIQGILIGDRNLKQVCLAIAGNSDPKKLATFGNLQQQTHEVVYDVAGGKIGFAKGGCS